MYKYTLILISGTTFAAAAHVYRLLSLSLSSALLALLRLTTDCYRLLLLLLANLRLHTLTVYRTASLSAQRIALRQEVPLRSCPRQHQQEQQQEKQRRRRLQPPVSPASVQRRRGESA